MQRYSKPGATHLDNDAVSSGSLDAWVWAERISVVGLFTLAVGYTLVVVQDLFVPVVLAWVIGAILRPIVESGGDLACRELWPSLLRRRLRS